MVKYHSTRTILVVDWMADLDFFVLFGTFTTWFVITIDLTAGTATTTAFFPFPLALWFFDGLSSKQGGSMMVIAHFDSHLVAVRNEFADLTAWTGTLTWFSITVCPCTFGFKFTF